MPIGKNLCILFRVRATKTIKDRFTEFISQFADHKYASRILGAIAFTESIFFPIPTDVFILPLSARFPARKWDYAFLATVFSVLGGLAGYVIGAVFWEALGKPLIDLYGMEESFARMGESFNDNAFLSIFIAGFTPIPFKVFTIAAGFFRIDLFMFIVASVVSRGVRFAIVSWIAAKYGAPIGKIIYKYFNQATSLIAIILIAWLALKFMIV